jgi:hypothetical protein
MHLGQELTQPMQAQFETVIRRIAGRHTDSDKVDTALESVRDRLSREIEQQDVVKAALLVNRFVRSLGGSTRESAQLERALLRALGMRPAHRTTVPIDDAISVISLGNHVRYLTVCLGIDWSDGMHFQGAVSDLANAAESSGGAEFTFTVSQSELECTVFFSHPGPGFDVQSALAGIDRITLNVSTSLRGTGVEVKFSVPHSNGLDGKEP